MARYDFKAVDDPSSWSRHLLSDNGSELGRLTDLDLARWTAGEIDRWMQWMLTDWREREAS